MDQVVQPSDIGAGDTSGTSVELPPRGEPLPSEGNPLLNMLIPNAQTFSSAGGGLKNALDSTAASIMGAKPQEAQPQTPIAPAQAQEGNAQAKLEAAQAANRPLGLSELAAAMGQTKLPPMPGVSGGAAKEIAEANAANVKATTDLGNDEANKAVEQAKLMSQHATSAKTELDALQQRMVAQNEFITKAAADVAAHKVDPNHFMNSRSTGQKIGNAIGLILGGIGGGMTHTENPVIGIINQKIQNDIQAQKDNLDTKKGLLRTYIEQGHDMESASRMTFGANQQIRASELEAAAMKMNPSIMRDQALAAAMKMKAEGVAQVQGAQERSINMATQNYNRLLTQQQLGQGMVQRMAHMAGLQGRTLGDDVVPLLPKEGHDVLAKVAPHQYRYANGPEAKKTYENGKLAADNVQNALDAFTRLREQYSGGKMLPDAAKTGAEIIAGNLQKNLELLYGYTRAPSGDEGAAVKSMVSNPLKFLTTDAKVRAVSKAISGIKDDRMLSLNGLLMGGP